MLDREASAAAMMPLGLLLRGLWRWKWRLVLLTALVFAGGVALVLSWPRYFVAQALVAPAETTGLATSTLLSPVPLLGGSLLDSRPAGNFAIYLDALRAPEAARMLARETPLLAHLTALRGAGPMGAIRRAFDLRIEADLDDAQHWLEEKVAATQGIATTTVTLTVIHRERDAALDALSRLHRAAEAKVRADLAELAGRRIAALEARLAQERDLFLRNALYDLLAQQQRAALVVGTDEAVAARLVSAPMVELRPSLPNRPLLILLLAVAAPLAVLGAGVAVLLLRWRP